MRNSRIQTFAATKIRAQRSAMPVAFAAAMLFAGALSAGAQSINNKIVLTPGTVIPVTLNNELSSNTAQQGDKFTASVDTSRDAYNQIMQGAIVDGVVQSVTSQSGSTAGSLDLAFKDLRLSDGRIFPINGTPASLDTKDLQTNSNGVLVAKNTKKDEHLAYAGYGAGAGAVLGLLSGGKINLNNIAIGGALGYAAGALLKGPTQVHDVDLKPGTPMGVMLGRTVSYYHKRSATSAASSSSGASSSGSHPTFIENGRKYYWSNGHRWYQDLSSGERVEVD